MSNIHQKQDRSDERENAKRRQETAKYIYDITESLCAMATKADLEFLAYLIDMARIEAYDRASEKVSEDTEITR